MSANTEREQLVAELLRELRAMGVPEGSWLVELAGARQSLRDVGALLRRLEDAIVFQYEGGASDGG
jgi:hypothetical protein